MFSKYPVSYLFVSGFIRLSFCLDAKRNKKSRLPEKNLFFLCQPKCSRVIFEQSPQLPGFTKVDLRNEYYFQEAIPKNIECRNQMKNAFRKNPEGIYTSKYYV